MEMLETLETLERLETLSLWLIISSSSSVNDGAERRRSPVLPHTTNPPLTRRETHQNNGQFEWQTQ